MHALYSVEPRHKFPANLGSSDYIRPRDYLRPIAGGFVVGFVYMTMVTVFCAIIDPTRIPVIMALGMDGVWVSAWLYAATALITAAVAHIAWHTRLQEYGPYAFERRLSVEMPPQEAFEMCLAASAQLHGQRLLGLNDATREIRVQTPGRNLFYEDTNIDIRLSETIDGVTHISISAQKAVTRFRMGLLLAMWGEKWIPLILSVGAREHANAMMDELTDNIRMLPNWNYTHAIEDVSEKAS
jgi:xanthosine utilization system XapX-like protein